MALILYLILSMFLPIIPIIQQRAYGEDSCMTEALFGTKEELNDCTKDNNKIDIFFVSLKDFF